MRFCRFISKAALVSLIGTYLLYLSLAISAIPQAVRWHIFGVHIILIYTTLGLSICGLFCRSLICVIYLVAVLPVVYFQFFS
jgi:hypothetical protein